MKVEHNMGTTSKTRRLVACYAQKGLIATRKKDKVIHTRDARSLLPTINVASYSTFGFV